MFGGMCLFEGTMLTIPLYYGFTPLFAAHLLEDIPCPKQQFRFGIDPLRNLLVLIHVFNIMHKTVKVPPLNESSCKMNFASWAYSSTIDITRSSICLNAQRERRLEGPLFVAGGAPASDAIVLVVKV